MVSSFSRHTYFLMTTDPVHVGVGGTRLGRVDNSIVREPGTRLPKIPGTSMHGAIRSYAAFKLGRSSCAGQTNHCGDALCPICQTFGYAKGVSESQSRSGMVSISDAHLLLYPVYSLAGPVWITSPSALKAVAAASTQADPGEMVLLPRALQTHPYLNLGWLMLSKAEGIFSLPPSLTSNIPQTVQERAVLVCDAFFSQIVNSNLEVRTSVSIDPETGAAQDKALFTYEAIPRAAILWMNVVVENHRGQFPGKAYCETLAAPVEEPATTNSEAQQDESEPKETSAEARRAQAMVEQYTAAGVTWETPLDVVESGLEWMADLGVGGMGTRGFGRVRRLVDQTQASSSQQEEHDD